MSIDPTYRAKAQEYLSATRMWQSEANSWGIELMFLQRMLDIYGLKADEGAQKERVRSLKSRMASFLSSGTDRVKAVLNAHDSHLTQIVEDRLLLQDRELPYRHGDAEQAMHEARTAYHGLRQSAFNLIEELKLG